MQGMHGDHPDWRVNPDAGDAEAYAVLSQDRVWNCFAIADLVPPFREYSRFAVAYETGSARAAACLVLRHPELTVIVPHGPAPGVAAILARVDLPERPVVHAQAQHLPALERAYRRRAGWREMLRMAVDAETFVPPAALAPAVERLTPADVPALFALYGLYPESVFRRDLVQHGTFFGVRAGDGIIAAGGTHVVAPAYGIAVLGNIFTHPDARRQGYAGAITAALVADLIAGGCPEVVLTVAAANSAAIRVYSRVGFRSHCHYWAGQAERVDSSA
jgi:ribosomal protein S18 acetylase RimI-like enzyme